MAIVLALLCSVTYGAGDFFGGSAARRIHPFAVGWVSHSVVLGPIALAAYLVGAGSVSGRDLAWGAVAGLLGAVGLLSLYAGLARGPMTMVAPTTALVGASLPVVVGGAFQNETHSALQWSGIGLALAAIVVVSLPPPHAAPDGADGIGGTDGPDRPPPGHRFNAPTFGLAIAAGAGFGLFFVALDRTSDGAGLWPLVSGRAASAAVFTLLVLTAAPFRRRVLTRDLRPTVGLVMWAAALDLTANVFYLLATRRGALSTVAVLSSLYPASTIVLASRILGERIGRVQAAGMALAVGAIWMVAAG